jgi:hypothetical protein
MDRYDMEIYNVPQLRGFQKTGPTATPIFGNSSNSPLLEVGQPAQPKSVYDWAAGDVDGYACQYLRKALGDDDLSDTVNNSETLRDLPEFILLSVGQRKKFTAADTGGLEKIKNNFEKCDEVSTVPMGP